MDVSTTDNMFIDDGLWKIDTIHYMYSFWADNRSRAVVSSFRLFFCTSAAEIVAIMWLSVSIINRSSRPYTISIHNNSPSQQF